MSQNNSKNNQSGNEAASASVAVVVRIRPMAKTELKRGCSIAVERATDGSPQISVNRNRWFKFNHVFDHTDTQRHIFETCVQAKVKKLLDGYNVTILAYGQTGSGKTYTMDTACSGVLDDDNKGVIPRSVECIFHDIELLKHEYDFSVTCTFVELYLEHTFDLFSPRRSPLEMHEWENRILMPGLTQLEVSSAEEVTKHLIWGSAKRTVASTAMSKKSSRSHALFTITIVARKLGGEGANSVATSMFNLVDLAGSERCTKSLTRGDRFKEGVNINKSLLALGNVLNALGSTKALPGHVCYRQSKLTRLLQQSLGGNSITLMIACVSCSDYNVAETLSTLRYANRTLQIKNRPVINMIPPVNEFEIQQQRGELQATKESDQKSSTDPYTSAATEALKSDEDDGIIETLMEQVDEIKLAYHDLQLHSQEARHQFNDGRGDEEPAPQLLHFQPEMPNSKQLELIDDLRSHNQTLEQKQLLYDFVCCNYSEREDNDKEAGADLLARGSQLLNQLREDTSAKLAEEQPKQLQLLHEQITKHLSQANELMMRKEDRKSLNELNVEINVINEFKWKIIKQYRQLKMESNLQVIPAESKDLETKSKNKGKTKGKTNGKKMRKCADAKATQPPSDAPEGQLSTQSQVKTIDQSEAFNWIDNELNVILSLVDAEQDMGNRQTITNEAKKTDPSGQIKQEQEKRIAHMDNLQQKAGIKDLDSRLRCFTSKNIYELKEIHQKTLNALVLQLRQQAVLKKEQKDRAEKQSSLLQENDQQINALSKQLSEANEDKEGLMQKVSLLLRSQEAPQLMDAHFNEDSNESGDKSNENKELRQPTGSEEQASSRNCIEGSEDLPLSKECLPRIMPTKDHGGTAPLSEPAYCLPPSDVLP